MNHYERLEVLREALRAVQEAEQVAHEAIQIACNDHDYMVIANAKQGFAFTQGHINALIRLEQENGKK